MAHPRGCVPSICNICPPSAARTRPRAAGRAVSWYGRGIEADELVEAFYQRLIRCYQHLGRAAEARATGERCRRGLAAALGTPPSAETLALIRTLGL